MQILLADDHTIFRQGLKLLLQNQPAYQVVAEAASLEQIPALLQRLPIELILLDYSMPGGDAGVVLANCKMHYPQLKIIALTGTQSGAVLKDLCDAGADAVLLKDISGNELLKTITEVMAGKTIIHATVLQQIEDCNTELTARELQTLKMIYQGLSNPEMAKLLHLSVKTIEKHRENLMRKLGVNNVVELIHKIQLLKLV